MHCQRLVIDYMSLVRIVERGDTFEVHGSDADIVSKLTGTKVKDPSNPVLFFNRQTIPSALSQLIAANYSIEVISPSATVIRKVAS